MLLYCVHCMYIIRQAYKQENSLFENIQDKIAEQDHLIRTPKQSYKQEICEKLLT